MLKGLLEEEVGPDQCGSVGWVLTHTVTGPQLDSWSGPVPGLQVQSLVRGYTMPRLWVWSPELIDVSLPLVLPLIRSPK